MVCRHHVTVGNTSELLAHVDAGVYSCLAVVLCWIGQQGLHDRGLTTLWSPHYRVVPAAVLEDRVTSVRKYECPESAQERVVFRELPQNSDYRDAE